IFGALEGYLGSICLAYKDGRSMGIATGVGALVNIILNYAGIRLFGAIGAAYATLISYFTMFAIAYMLTRKHICLAVDIKRDMLGYVLILTAGVITMYPGLAGGNLATNADAGITALSSYGWTYAADAVFFMLLIILYRDQAAGLVRRIRKG
ncbi:MAG: polysaccharide biosynthesis C-terminal domain-containing protein, partial [Lachnospiraceae bacterium]|nr:polysaccharide biosynthesis C-terminal domain-containing protein [Lachnospiraceae bacterium]